MSASQQRSDSQYRGGLHCRNARELTVFDKPKKMRMDRTFILRLTILQLCF